MQNSDQKMKEALNLIYAQGSIIKIQHSKGPDVTKLGLS